MHRAAVTVFHQPEDETSTRRAGLRQSSQTSGARALKGLAEPLVPLDFWLCEIICFLFVQSEFLSVAANSILTDTGWYGSYSPLQERWDQPE